MINIRNILIVKIILSAFLIAISGSKPVSAQSYNIKNDTFWNTKNGKPIYSQGGGIFKFTDPGTGKEKYYWYGVHYKQAEAYREDPLVTQRGNGFEGVTCYTSTDLVNWKFEANVLTKEEVGGHGWMWLGRTGVAYV